MRAKKMMEQVKNPYARQNLQTRIGQYKIDLSNQISQYEAKLIHDKRHVMAIDAMEKLAKTTYNNPESYQSNLNDAYTALNSLSLLPQEKEKLIATAREQISYMAGLGTLHNDPNLVLNPNINHAWKENLDIPQVIKIENQARHMLEHQQRLMQGEVKRLSRSHFESILNTGQGINGFENLALAASSKDSPHFQHLALEEQLYKSAFNALQQVKYMPLLEGEKLLQNFIPESGDPRYHEKQKLYELLAKKFHEQIEKSKNDPVGFVEELFSEELGKEMSFVERLKRRKDLQRSKGIDEAQIEYLTKHDKRLFNARLKSNDPLLIKQEIEKIISIGGDVKIGTEILDELLSKNKKLNELKVPVHFFAESLLYDRDVQSDFLEMIPLHNQIISNMSKNDKDRTKNEIEKNPIFKTWKSKMTLHQIYNEEEVGVTKAGIKDLAYFYQADRKMDITKSVDRAVEKLINDRYIVTEPSIDTSVSMASLYPEISDITEHKTISEFNAVSQD